MANMPYDCYDWDDIEQYDPKEELIYSCREHMRDIVKYLFSDEPLDRTALDDSISGICDLLEVDIPPKMLTIERKQKCKFFSNLDTQALYITKKTI